MFFLKFFSFLAPHLDFNSLSLNSIEEFFRCLSAQIQLQLSPFPDNIKHVDQVRSLLFSTIDSLFYQPSFIAICNQNENLMNALLEVLKAESQEKLIISILSLLLSKSAPNQLIVKKVGQLLSESSGILETARRLLIIIHNSYKSRPRTDYKNSSISTDFHVFIHNLSQSSSTPASETLEDIFLLIFQLVESLQIHDIRWDYVCSLISLNAISDRLFNAILSLLSLTLSFTGLNYISASPLFCYLLKTSKRKEIIELLHPILIKSPVQALNFYFSNAIPFLLSDIDESFELILKMVSFTFSIVSSRSLLNKYFDILELNKENVETFNLLIQYLSAAIRSAKPSVPFFFLVHPKSSSLKPPTPTNLEFTSSFHFVFILNFPKFSAHDRITLVAFKCLSQYMSFSILQNSFLVESDFLKKPSHLTIKFPSNEWFTLIISVENLTVMHIYLNSELVATSSFGSSRFNDSISSLIVFLSHNICFFCFFICSLLWHSL